jgi:predicted negative regulator of RcsB-dependent stress response
MRRKADLAERMLLAFGLLMLGGYMGWTLYSEHNRIELEQRAALALQAKIIDENLGL